MQKLKGLAARLGSFMLLQMTPTLLHKIQKTQLKGIVNHYFNLHIFLSFCSFIRTVAAPIERRRSIKSWGWHCIRILPIFKLKIGVFGKNVVLYSRWRCNRERRSVGADAVCHTSGLFRVNRLVQAHCQHGNEQALCPSSCTYVLLPSHSALLREL